MFCHANGLVGLVLVLSALGSVASCAPPTKPGFDFTLDNNALIVGGPVLHCRAIDPDLYECEMTPRGNAARVLQEGIYAEVSATAVTPERVWLSEESGWIYARHRRDARSVLVLVQSLMWRNPQTDAVVENQTLFRLAGGTEGNPCPNDIAERLTVFLRESCGIDQQVVVLPGVNGRRRASVGDNSLLSDDGSYWLLEGTTCRSPILDESA